MLDFAMFSRKVSSLSYRTDLKLSMQSSSLFSISAFCMVVFSFYIIIGRHNVRTCLKYSIGTKAKTTLILSLSLKYIALFASASIIETGTFLTEVAYVSGRCITVQSGVHDFDQRPGFAAVLPVRLRFAVVQDQHEFPAFPPVSRDTHSVKRPCIAYHRGRLLHPAAL